MSPEAEEYLTSRNHPLRRIARKVSKRLFKKKSGLAKRFRILEELPADVRDLAMEMTHYDSRRRLTVRAASRHPWLAEPDELG